MDQANPVAQEALALLVDPVYNKEKEVNRSEYVHIIYSIICF